MNNLILSAACGLKPDQIEFFLKSLRKYYHEDVFFLVGKKDFSTKEFLKTYNCFAWFLLYLAWLALCRMNGYRLY